MTLTKLLIGQILIVLAIVIAGVWMATQWAAAELAYQPELGAPSFLLDGKPIYRPWDLFLWWYHYDAYAPHVFDRAGMLASASRFVGAGAAIACPIPTQGATRKLGNGRSAVGESGHIPGNRRLGYLRGWRARLLA